MYPGYVINNMAVDDLEMWGASASTALEMALKEKLTNKALTHWGVLEMFKL